MLIGKWTLNGDKGRSASKARASNMLSAKGPSDLWASSWWLPNAIEERHEPHRCLTEVCADDPAALLCVAALVTPMEAACAAENNPHWLSANRARAVRASGSISSRQQHASDRTHVRSITRVKYEAGGTLTLARWGVVVYSGAK